MTAKEIIEHEADRFTGRLRDYVRTPNGHEDFKSDIESKLYNYHESLDKLIFLYRVHKNVTEVYDKHIQVCKHKDQPHKCSENLLYNKAKFFTEQEIKQLNPDFDYTILRPNINSDLVKSNLIRLRDFPEAGKLYQRALDKLNEGKHERNLVDDLRLSLESLLKEKFKNDKSLENQVDILGTHLKDTDTSKEIINMIVKLVDYYSKYQNAYIKHNDAVKPDEIELIINLTSSFTSFIINK